LIENTNKQLIKWYLFRSLRINKTRGYNIHLKVCVFLFFSCNMEMIDAAPLETIVDEDEEGDSDIEID